MATACYHGMLRQQTEFLFFFYFCIIGLFVRLMINIENTKLWSITWLTPIADAAFPITKHYDTSLCTAGSRIPYPLDKGVPTMKQLLKALVSSQTVSLHPQLSIRFLTLLYHGSASKYFPPTTSTYRSCADDHRYSLWSANACIIPSSPDYHEPKGSSPYNIFNPIVLCRSPAAAICESRVYACDP